MQTITLSKIMNGPWKDRAIYTAEERGIPLFADGLKPVQRFLVCKALKIAKSKFEKVATIATIATEGYHHGEQSAAAALVGLAADFSNNLPLFEGDGNFGNVLNPSAGAPRYIYAKLTPLFEHLYKDMDLCPKHDDPDHTPPKYYLPIIPMVLVNGIKGIATGYATDIPPHNPINIIDWLIERAETDTPKTEIAPKYYGFTGSVTKDEICYTITGRYEYIGANKIRVTELPRGYTCQSYDSVLNKLQDKGIIVDYENNSRMNSFDYTVVLKRGTKWSDEEIIRNLKLKTTHAWNLTTVSNEGKIQEWNKSTGITDIMEAFYQFRIPFVQTRINNQVAYLENQEQYQVALQTFCTDVIENKFSFQGLSESDFKQVLQDTYKVPDNHLTSVMNMPVRNFTTQMVKKLNSALAQTRKELKYYRSTNAEKEYKKDLESLKTAFLEYQAERA